MRKLWKNKWFRIPIIFFGFIGLWFALVGLDGRIGGRKPGLFAHLNAITDTEGNQVVNFDKDTGDETISQRWEYFTEIVDWKNSSFQSPNLSDGVISGASIEELNDLKLNWHEIDTVYIDSVTLRLKNGNADTTAIDSLKIADKQLITGFAGGNNWIVCEDTVFSGDDNVSFTNSCDWKFTQPVSFLSLKMYGYNDDGTTSTNDVYWYSLVLYGRIFRDL